MPSVALRSFQVYGANDEVLTSAVEEIKDAVSEAKSSGEVQVVKLYRRGYREDIQVGDIFVVPASVCDRIEDFPLGLLLTQVRHQTPESQIEIEMGALVDKDAISSDTLKAFKDAVFREGGEGEVKTLLIFRACWSSPYEGIGFLYDEKTVLSRLREVAYAAPFNPALSSVLDALKACSDSHASFVISGPVAQHLYQVDKSSENDYPKFVPGVEYAQAEPTKKKASLTRPVIRLSAVNITALEKAVLSDEELALMAAMDGEVGETVVASEESGLRESPLAALRLAAEDGVADPNAAWSVVLTFAGRTEPVSWSAKDADGAEVGSGDAHNMTGAIKAGLEKITEAGQAQRVKFTLSIPGSDAVSRVGIRLEDGAPVSNQGAVDLARALFGRLPAGTKVASELPAIYDDLEKGIGEGIGLNDQGMENGAPDSVDPQAEFAENPDTDAISSILSSVNMADPEAGTCQTTAITAGLIVAAAEEPVVASAGWTYDEQPASVSASALRVAKSEYGDLGDAVDTAYSWHGGQSSPLYSFASLGGKLHKESGRGALENEIDHCINVVKSRPDDYSPDELERLENLLAVAQSVPAENNDEDEGGSAAKHAAFAPETERAVRRFVENFAGHYLPLKALKEELSRLTSDVKSAVLLLNEDGLVQPYGGGVKVLNRDLMEEPQGHRFAAYHIRNQQGQKWACADVDGVKLGGYWTDAEQEAHDFHNEEEAHEEVRRNCLGDAIVIPKGIGPLKVAGSWWSPSQKFAAHYPELANKAVHVPGKRSSLKVAESWWEPGRALEQFFPEMTTPDADFPTAQVPGLISQQSGPVINPFGAPGNGVEQAPVGMAGCPDGLNKMYDGVPLKQETNFYGPEFMREYYAPHADIDVDDITVKQSAWKKAGKKTAAPGEEPQGQPAQPSLLDALNVAVPAEEPKTPYIDPQQNGDGLDNPSPAYLMVDKLVKGCLGAYTAQLVGAFQFTQRPLELETPFEDKIVLDEVLEYGGASSTVAVNAAKQQLSHALDLLSDDEKKQIVNDGSAQAAVWCENSNGSGGFTYEVFARVEAMEGAVLTLKVVTGIR